MKPAKKKILECIKKTEKISPKEVSSITKYGSSTVTKYMAELLKDGYITKIGNSPHVHYVAVPYASEIMQGSFVYKDGNITLFGIEGFRKWSEKVLKEYSYEEKVKIYEDAYREYQEIKGSNGYYTIDLKIEDVVLDGLFCINLYNMPIKDGITKRTKSALLFEIVKGSGNQKKLKENVKYFYDDIKKIVSFVLERDIEAVSFIPPTASRPVQVMKLLKDNFESRLTIPTVKIKRNFTDPAGSRMEQKHIGSVEGRIKNARETYNPIFEKKYKSVLLVDDIIGSGATINEVAKKIKEKGIAEKVYAMGLVGINSRKLLVVRKT